MADKMMSESEKAVIVALKTVYWITKEQIAIHKYGSLVDFLKHFVTPNISSLVHAGNASYTSDTASVEFLEALSDVISKDVIERLQKSPVISLLADESTDCMVLKKPVLYARVIDESFTPSTHFLANVQVS